MRHKGTDALDVLIDGFPEDSDEKIFRRFVELIHLNEGNNDDQALLKRAREYVRRRNDI